MERSKTHHDRLWAAIDAIAVRHGLSPSGLARRAGLDATAFNKSKRFTSDGRPRWPSTESIAKILGATGCDLVELVGLIDARASRRREPPPAALDGVTGFAGFHEEARPGERDAAAAEMRRSIEVADDAMLPVYRKGDVLIVATDVVVEPGDRVVLTVDAGPLEARVYLGRDDGGLVFAPLAGGERAVIDADRVGSLARILWVSQ